jgi:predicted MFS family arabinose efflux permease
MEVGGFLALWVIGYGFVQAAAPALVRRSRHGHGPGGGTARLWAVVLALVPAGIALALGQGWPAGPVLIGGLAVFGVVFALNSAVHSYLILAYSDFEKVSLNVGFYYMANAGGRLTGTVLSGWVYQTHGLEGCLWWSAAFVLMAAALSLRLPPVVAGGAAAGGADAHQHDQDHHR